MNIISFAKKLKPWERHHMKRLLKKNQSFKTISTLILCAVVLTGCGSAIQKKSPLISHVHIGHTLNGWVTTPDKKGLLTTAVQEAKIILDQSLNAKKSNNLAQKKKHMTNALHALDPNIQAKGPGKGYGLIRAVTESSAHLQFAASSDDASANIKRTVPIIVNSASKIASSSNQLKVFGQAAVNSTSISEFDALNNEFLTTAKNINGNGGTSSYNLPQLKRDIIAMVSKEKPAYTTVDSYFLFNLIRLPSGKWAFSKNKSAVDTNGY